MRMFAGPNGSGKSTLKAVLPHQLLGVYINPDEIEVGIRQNGFFRVADFEVTTSGEEILPYFVNAPLLHDKELGDAATKLRFADGRLMFEDVVPNAYFASVTVDFLRRKLLEQKKTFTFETVMSHPSKVDLLREAQHARYRTYLYYIATDDPEINISRVLNRVKLGGHSVPTHLIEERYYRSLDLLMDAIRHTNRAYVFDNSGENLDHTWLAEITDGTTLVMKTDLVPGWFRRAVLDRIL
jgi:predicted ABC-type ATPase